MMLQKGSKIAIVATARKVTFDEIAPGIAWLKENGFVPVFDERLFASDFIFAGDDALRAAVLQSYLDNPDIAAIWLARGGYGSVRIIDRLDFTSLRQHPKPIIGFSDGTALHATWQSHGLQSIHAAMPYHFSEKTAAAAKQSLIDALTGKALRYEIACHDLNRLGEARAAVVGGNLSVLYGLLGSSTFPDTRGKILFLEEVDEYIYHVERMMIGLQRAGALRHLKALVVGGLTDIHDNPEPFGKTVEQAISDVVSAYHYPVCFGFPAGHFSDNRAIIMGAEMFLQVNQNQVVAEQN